MRDNLPDATEALRRLEVEWERYPGASLGAALAGAGPGWQALAEEGWRAVTEAGGRIRQLKEKYGALTIYFDRVGGGRHDEVDRRIREIYTRSLRTCEWCGAPGECRDDAYIDSLPAASEWWKTLCDEHALRWYIGHERWWDPPQAESNGGRGRG